MQAATEQQQQWGAVVGTPWEDERWDGGTEESSCWLFFFLLAALLLFFGSSSFSPPSTPPSLLWSSSLRLSLASATLLFWGAFFCFSGILFYSKQPSYTDQTDDVTRSDHFPRRQPPLMAAVGLVAVAPPGSLIRDSLSELNGGIGRVSQIKCHLKLVSLVTPNILLLCFR